MGAGRRRQRPFSLGQRATRLLAAMALWAFGLAPLVRAQTAGCEALTGPGEPACTAQAGNPIDVATGNKFQREVDMPALPGVLGLELVRVYNSAAAQSDAALTMVGRGWRLSYDWRLRFDAGGRDEQVVLVQGDGREWLLGKSRGPQGWEGVWRPADPAAGMLSAVRINGEVGYDWIDLSGLRRRFNAQGWLMQIEAPSGHRLHIEREAKGDITRVTDPQGRQLVMRLLDDQRALQERRFGGIQSVQTPVGAYEYDYGPEPGRASTSLALLALLRAVRHAGIERRYLYEDGAQPALLTGIRVRGQGSDGQAMDVRVATWAYDRQGRAVLSMRGEAEDGAMPAFPEGEAQDPARRWRNPPVETVRLQYLSPQHGTSAAIEGLTVLRNSNGQISLYRHRLIAGRARIVEAFGAGCASCGAMNLRQHFDAQGRLTGIESLQPVIPDPGTGAAGLRALRAGATLSRLLIRRDGQGRVLGHESVAVSAGGRKQGLGRDPSPGQGPTGVMVFQLGYPASDPPRYPQDWRPIVLSRPSLREGQRHEWRLSYNERGQVLSEVETGFDPLHAAQLSRRHEWFYLQQGELSLLHRHDGPLPNGPTAQPQDSDITVLHWDRAGRYIEQMEQPQGLRQTVQRDAAGRVIRRTTQDGFRAWSTVLGYGADGRHLSNVLQVQTEGRLLIPSESGDETRSLQLRQRAAYDALGHLTRQWDAAGRLIVRGYDGSGHLASVADAQGHQARWLRDGEGQVRAQGLFRPGQPLPARADYFWRDAAGHLSAHLRPDGRFDQWQRDAQGRIDSWLEDVQVLHRVRRDAPAGVLVDDFGRWRQVPLSDHGPRQLGYDEADRVSQVHYADGTGLRFERDALGRVLRRETLDAQGQVQATVRWRFEGWALVQMSDEQQVIDYRIDALGRRVGERLRLRQLATPVQHRSDLDPDTGLLQAQHLIDGQVLRIERSDAAQGRTPIAITRRPSWAHRLEDWAKQHLSPHWAGLVGQWLPGEYLLAGMRVDAFDGLVGLRTGNGIETRWRRDLAGRLTGMRAGDVAGWSLDYGRGPSPIKASAAWLGEDLDALERSRLRGQGVLSTALQIRYGLDRKGALASAWPEDAAPARREPVRAPTEGPTGGLQHAAGAAASDQHDARGRLISDARFLYRYASLGQLEQVRHRDGRLLAEYRHDGLGRRISKQVHDAQGRPSGQRHFVWHGERLIAELDDKGRWLVQYLYLTGVGAGSTQAAWPYAKIESARNPDNPDRRERLLYIHVDHRGAPIAMSDARGRAVWQAEGYSDPWQLQVRPSNAARLNLRLPGHYHDAETGLEHQHYRSYDPRRHRYLQPDPLGYPDGPDAYRYAGGNPLHRADPLGLYEEDVHYYLTYFLGVVAGLSDRQATVMARADRYIDDNPYTEPFAGETVRRFYHFTQAGYDPAPGPNDVLTLPPAPAVGEIVDLPVPAYSKTYVAARINNPSNPQIERLQDYAMAAPTPCVKAQLYGEFLHAFQDTFAHRDFENVPYKAAGGHVLSPELPSHSPDRTYNHIDSLGLNWQVNEARTLEMEKEVFHLLQADFGTRARVSWEALEPVLKAFNRDTTPVEQVQTKTQVLENFLLSHGQLSVLKYDSEAARKCRHAFLDTLDPKQYPGTILDTPFANVKEFKRVFTCG